jgi:DEAD/DEAH box helicase domain-containing protein
MENILFLDLEPQYSFDEVGENKKQKLAVAVVLDPVQKCTETYWEKDVDRLIDRIMDADLVVGYNILHFDLQVLSAYTPLPIKEIPVFDLLVEIKKSNDCAIPLESVYQGTFNQALAPEGFEVLHAWRKGDHVFVESCCAAHVKAMEALYQEAIQGKMLFYQDETTPEGPVPIFFDPNENQ